MHHISQIQLLQFNSMLSADEPVTVESLNNVTAINYSVMSI